MSNREILELILNTSGFEIRDYELIRDGCLVGYDFTAYKNNDFQFRVSSDSFNGAVYEALKYIYDTEDVKFKTIF